MMLAPKMNQCTPVPVASNPFTFTVTPLVFIVPRNAFSDEPVHVKSSNNVRVLAASATAIAPGITTLLVVKLPLASHAMYPVVPVIVMDVRITLPYGVFGDVKKSHTGLLVTPVQSIDKKAVDTLLFNIAPAPATLSASTNTASAEVGTDAPVPPPLEADHVPVLFQLEVVEAGNIA